MSEEHDYSESMTVPDNLTLAIHQWRGWVNTAAMHHRNETYYRGLLTEIAEMIGQEAYTADDGSVYDTPLCIKVPELVRARLATLPVPPPVVATSEVG